MSATTPRGDLVVLKGGPRDRFWYFADDVSAMALAAERMGREWPYVATSRTVAHPTLPELGRVHEFRVTGVPP